MVWALTILKENHAVFEYIPLFATLHNKESRYIIHKESTVHSNHNLRTRTHVLKETNPAKEYNTSQKISQNGNDIENLPIISSIDPSATNSFFFSGYFSDSSTIAFKAAFVSSHWETCFEGGMASRTVGDYSDGKGKLKALHHGKQYGIFNEGTDSKKK